MSSKRSKPLQSVFSMGSQVTEGPGSNQKDEAKAFNPGIILRCKKVPLLKFGLLFRFASFPLQGQEQERKNVLSTISQIPFHFIEAIAPLDAQYDGCLKCEFVNYRFLTFKPKELRENTPLFVDVFIDSTLTLSLNERAFQRLKEKLFFWLRFVLTEHYQVSFDRIEFPSVFKNSHHKPIEALDAQLVLDVFSSGIEYDLNKNIF